LWPQSTGHIRTYLELFERPGTSALLRLAAHAFLHIAFDLPRVIAPTLAPASPTSRASMRTTFLRPGPIFLKAFLTHARVGELGRLGRVAGRFKPVRVLAYWVLALRSVAWIQAETLADRGVSASHEKRMAIQLLKAAEEARTHRGVLGVPDLDNSRLLQLAPAPVLDAVVGGVVGAIVGSALSVAAILWLWDRNTESSATAAQIDAFGALVYRGMLRSMDPDGRVEDDNRQR
jgi:hypothetical protein